MIRVVMYRPEVMLLVITKFELGQNVFHILVVWYATVPWLRDLAFNIVSNNICVLCVAIGDPILNHTASGKSHNMRSDEI